MQLDSLVREIMNAAGRVHDTLGPGFLESIYARALGSELRSRGLAIEREKQVRIWYGSQIVGKHNLDLIVEGMAIVEVKANHGSLAIHSAQLRSYLRATDCAVGILVNFGMPTLQLEVLLRQEIAENSE